MERVHKIDVRLQHRVQLSEAVKCLASALDCDDWYVACHHDHLLVVELSQYRLRKYAIRFECTSPVEKAIYHDSKVASLAITPLGEAGDLTVAKVAELKACLATLE